MKLFGNKINEVVEKVLGFVFFPIFIPIYVVCYLLFVEGGYFIGYGMDFKVRFLGIFLVNLVFFPFVTIGLLRGLNFIKDLRFGGSKERIIVLFALSIFYFWGFYLMHHDGQVPRVVERLMLNFFVLVSLAPFFNYRQRMSLTVSVVFSVLFCLFYERVSLGVGGYFSYPFLMYVVIFCGGVLTLKGVQFSFGEVRVSVFVGFLSGLISHIVLGYINRF